MEIKIQKKEDGEIVFYIEGEENKFEYESFDKLIEKTYSNDDEIQYSFEEELKEYKDLLAGVIQGARTEDFRNAVKAAKEANAKLELEEKNTGE